MTGSMWYHVCVAKDGSEHCLTAFVRETVARAPLGTHIHVFALPLEGVSKSDEPRVCSLARCLSPEETERARRFRHRRDRVRYVVGRTMLRCVAGVSTGRTPETVEVVPGPHGKPVVAGAQLSVNVSHSGDWVLVAATEGARVGVDVEFRDPSVDVGGVAGTVFSSWENEALRACPEDVRTDLFYEIWTRKEAVIKADGRGIQFGLQRFDVEFRPGRAPRVRAVRSGSTGGGFADVSRFRLHPLRLDAEHAAAVCYEGPRRSVHTHLLAPIVGL